MLHGIINEQEHWLDVRDGISKNEYISHAFLAKVTSLFCLNLRYWLIDSY